MRDYGLAYVFCVNKPNGPHNYVYHVNQATSTKNTVIE